MITVYAYISAKFESSFIVKLLDADGYILSAFECYSYKKAPEIAQKFAPPSADLIWLANPWGSDEFKLAHQKSKRVSNFSGAALNAG